MGGTTRGFEGVETVLLAAPVTPDERLSAICERSHGFVYGVNLMGVTGERKNLASSSSVLAKRLKAVTDKPVIMGLGISGPLQAVAAAEHADGVVVALGVDAGRAGRGLSGPDRRPSGDHPGGLRPRG